MGTISFEIGEEFDEEIEVEVEVVAHLRRDETTGVEVEVERKIEGEKKIKIKN